MVEYNIKVDNIQSGQRKAYGDDESEYNITFTYRTVMSAEWLPNNMNLDYDQAKQCIKNLPMIHWVFDDSDGNDPNKTASMNDAFEPCLKKFDKTEPGRYHLLITTRYND